MFCFARSAPLVNLHCGRDITMWWIWKRRRNCSSTNFYGTINNQLSLLVTASLIWHWDQRVNQHLEYCRLRKLEGYIKPFQKLESYIKPFRKLEGYIKPFPMVFTHTIINVTFRGDALNNAIVAPTRPQLVPFEWGEPAKMWNLKKTLEHDGANEASTVGAFQDNVLLRLRRWAIKRWHVRSNAEEL